MGAMNAHRKNRMAQVSAVRPVRPPAATPAVDSTNVVTVEVPVHAPTTVPMESDKSAGLIQGISPFSPTMPAWFAVPTSVPMVSNKSMRQSVTISVTMVAHPSAASPSKLNLNSVSSTMSPNAGTHEALAMFANGSVPRIATSQAQ